MPRSLSFYGWYPADYRADTRHLTREQHFAYREILDEIFLTGQDETPPSIPDDDAMLMEICRAASAEEWAETRRVLIDGARGLLRSENGRIVQRRMTAEIERAHELSGKRRTAARKRWDARAETARHDEKEPERVGSHGGNGHGAPTMSVKQFRFYAGRVSKWLDENRDRFVGGGEQGSKLFDAAFERGVGITWKDWQREKAIHDAIA